MSSDVNFHPLLSKVVFQINLIYKIKKKKKSWGNLILVKRFPLHPLGGIFKDFKRNAYALKKQMAQ